MVNLPSIIHFGFEKETEYRHNHNQFLLLKSLKSRGLGTRNVYDRDKKKVTED